MITDLFFHMLTQILNNIKGVLIIIGLICLLPIVPGIWLLISFNFIVLRWFIFTILFIILIGYAMCKLAAEDDLRGMEYEYGYEIETHKKQSKTIYCSDWIKPLFDT